MIKVVKIFLFLSIFQPVLKAQEFDPVKLTEKEKKELARRQSKYFFNTVKEVIEMGRNERPVYEVQALIKNIWDQFDDNATIQESSCKNGIPHNGEPKSIKSYLIQQYSKARKKYFTIEFEDLGVEPILGRVDEYTVMTKFRQVYDSKYYSDITVKGIVIQFRPDRRGVPTPKIMKIVVLQTECEPGLKSRY